MATPNGLSSNCGGAATATGGSASVSLAGGTLAANAGCLVTVNVTGTIAGVKSNSVQVTSTEGSTGNTSTANITVVAPPVLTKSFGAASIPLTGSTSLSFTVQNNNGTVALTGIGFSDTLPAGLVISSPNGLAGTCGGGAITATPGNERDQPSRCDSGNEHLVHLLGECDRHNRRHKEQHDGGRDLDRGRHRRDGLGQHGGGSATGDCQGI